MPYHYWRTLITVGFLSLAVVLMGGSRTVAMADDPQSTAQPTLADRFPAFQEVMRATAAQLALLPAQGDALSLFKNVIGPRLGLRDAAMTVGAKGLSSAVSRELLLPDLTRSASELVRGFGAWQLAQTARDLGASASPERVAEFQRQTNAQMAWFGEGTTLEPSLRLLLELSKEISPQGTTSDATGGPILPDDSAVHMAGVAAQIENWAIQTVHREWFRILNWKDQVRQQRGLVRLCGTWQWSIHNHQNHREEKTAVVFAPAGSPSATSPAEIIVLGDSVYLRWETSAGVQEDSLLFSGEGQRLEGTFVNTAGGWGSITGKRTASCFPKGEKPASGQGRHR